MWRSAGFSSWPTIIFDFRKRFAKLFQEAVHEKTMQNHAGGGTEGVTDLAHISHTVITWCSMVKYGVILV